MYSKNEVVTLLIDDIGNDGEGIGHIDGYALFVKDALPGDLVKAKIVKAGKNYSYARIEEIVKPSADRVDAKCVNASRCGGCTLQHYRYEKQLLYKERKVKNCLVRIGGYEPDYIESVMEPVMGMDNPYGYRNKAQFPVGVSKDGKALVGFYAGRTHSIIDCDYCHIQPEISNDVLKIVRKWIEDNNIKPYDEMSHAVPDYGTRADKGLQNADSYVCRNVPDVKREGRIRHVLIRTGFHTGDVMVCLVVTDKRIPALDDLWDRLQAVDGIRGLCLNINGEKTNRILGDKVFPVYGDSFIEDYIGDVRFRISPLSFYQVNPVQTEKLYRTVLDYAELTGNEVVWDLYCGIGTISLFLAGNAAAVLGIEIIPQAIEDAKANAVLNNIGNTLFIAGAAEDVEKNFDGNSGYGKYEKPDVVIVDPPRKGCDGKLIDTILDVNPPKIVYVSCDPATLARDVKLFGGGGYGIERIRTCDMFGMNVHIESIVLLTRRPQAGK